MGKSIFDALGPLIGAGLGSVFPGVGTALGGSLGSAFGGDFFGKAAGGLISAVGPSLFGGDDDGPSAPAAPSPYVPQQDPAMGLPASLSQFGNFSPNQQSTNIATQGTYGGGEGPEENKYFLNLINRRLVDQTGKVGDTSGINPVENSFLSTLGLGGYTDSNDLLTKIHGYKP